MASIPRLRPAACALALLASGAGVLAGCGGSSAGTPESRVSPAQLRGALPGVLVSAPDVTLTTTSGHPFNLADAATRNILLVYFGYTHCPDECPTSMADMATALRMSPSWVRSQVTVAFVTTDPRRDTPPVLRRWLGNFDPSFVGLTGSPAEIRTAEARMRLPIAYEAPLKNKRTSVGAYAVNHFSAFVGYDRAGKAVVLYPSGMKPVDIAADLPVLVANKVEGG